MQVHKPSIPLTTGLKRARLQSFPGAFEEQLLRLFSARSAFLRDQLECMGEDDTSVSLQLPEGTGALWLDCILTPPPDLKKFDDETIAAYLKASAFFQDCYMVSKLCRILGRRLFKAHVEGAGASSSDQQPASKQHIDQVLGQLSSDVVIELLRSAPGSLWKQLPHLSPPLASLAALAHIPSLAAVCSPVPECGDQGASVEHAELTLCVPGASTREEPVDVSGASMWLNMNFTLENILHHGLFSLASRPGVTVCRLLARVSSLQGVTLCIPDSACLLLGPRALKLHGVTFTGGAVVCSGSRCQATLEHTVFDRCSLLVLSAAQVALSKVAFKNMNGAWSRVGVFVHGVSSQVAVQGGTVAGGLQAVAVQAGGHLKATGLTTTEVLAVGAEVQGEGSKLSLTGCEMIEFGGPELVRYAGEAIPIAVHVHSRSSAQLSRLFIRGGLVKGVRVASGAAATLDDCKCRDVFIEARLKHERARRLILYGITDESHVCVDVLDSTCRLTRCTLSGSCTGLHVSGTDSSVHASECHFQDNRSAAWAERGATLTAVSCTSSENTYAGFYAQGVDSVLEVTDCVSDEDATGCRVEAGAVLRATRVAVTNSNFSSAAYVVCSRSHAVLKDCSAKDCRRCGVLCSDSGSKVHAEGCTFQSNGGCGVMAVEEAEVTVEGCHSSQHITAAGYRATYRARMKVSGSVSEGDQQGCSVDDGGKITMEDVTVNGTLQSGHMPKRRLVKELRGLRS